MQKNKRMMHKASTKLQRIKRVSRKYNRWQFFLLAFIALLAMLWTLIAMANSNVTTVSRTLSVPGLPPELEGYTIVQLTDLNGATFGAGQEKLIRAINAVNYDAICMTGDMIGAAGNPQPLYELIEGLNTKKPIMFINGDKDPSPLSDAPNADGIMYSDYMLRLQSMGVTYLDSPCLVSVGDARIWFSSGLQLNINTRTNLETIQEIYNAALADPNHSAAELAYDAYRLDCAQKLDRAAKDMKSVDLHITLSHMPLCDDFVHSLQYAGGDMAASSVSGELDDSYLRLIDLALCGHYVGGQWRMPFVGALYVPDERLPRGGWLPEQSQVSGLRRSNSVYIYTSAGLGCSASYNLPPFRLFNAPEIAIIKLTGKLGK